MKKLKPAEMKMSVYDLLLILLIIMAISGFIILRIEKNGSSRAQLRDKQSQSYTYHSKSMRMSLLVPDSFKIESKNNTITFSSQDGDIEVARIATNFDTVSEYFENLAAQNKYTEYQTTPLRIHDADSLLVEIAVQGKPQRIYFIYVDHWIYSISTTKMAFYTIQDSMAESFSYIPDNL